MKLTKQTVEDTLKMFNGDKFKAAEYLGTTVKVLYCILNDI